MANTFETNNVFYVIHQSVASSEAMVIKMPFHRNY